MRSANVARLPDDTFPTGPKEPTMPTRDHAPQGLPCWLDLGTSDPAKSRAFYGELFGWASEANEDFGGYINFTKGDLPVAGGMQNDGTMGPDGWSVYLATDDIAKLAEAAPANGGTVASPPMAVGDLGQMAFVTDPTGGFVGAWQSGEHTGFGLHNEAGSPGWFELFTRDFPAAVAFYRDVYGSDIEIVSDEDEFRYAVFVRDGLQWAGIMDASAFLPDDVPAHWSVYFQVDSADASIAQAESLGASVLDPAQDTPYGRLATLQDPTGARFKLIQPPAEG